MSSILDVVRASYDLELQSKQSPSQVFYKNFAKKYKLFCFVFSSDSGGSRKPLLVLNGKNHPA